MSKITPSRSRLPFVGAAAIHPNTLGFSLPPQMRQTYYPPLPPITLTLPLRALHLANGCASRPMTTQPHICLIHVHRWTPAANSGQNAKTKQNTHIKTEDQGVAPFAPLIKTQSRCHPEKTRRLLAPQEMVSTAYQRRLFAVMQLR